MDGDVTPSSYRSSAGDGNAQNVAFALVIALFIRTFLFQPFNIPSGSMENTLLVGDYLFVSKFSYGYSNYSFPWSPNLFSGRILRGEPQRGDVVVFRLPARPWEDYIKRLDRPARRPDSDDRRRAAHQRRAVQAGTGRRLRRNAARRLRASRAALSRNVSRRLDPLCARPRARTIQARTTLKSSLCRPAITL